MLAVSISMCALAAAAVIPGSAVASPSSLTTVPGIVDINTNLGYEDAAAAGTGMVLTSSGEVLTNNHVIRGATTIRVTDIANGHTYAATVVGYNVAADIAVLSSRTLRDSRQLHSQTPRRPRSATRSQRSGTRAAWEAPQAR